MPEKTVIKTRILILGGGGGGLYAALELDRTIAQRPEVEVTLVNRENFILFTPMLHEVAASDLDLTHIVNPLRKMLKRQGPAVARNIAAGIDGKPLINTVPLPNAGHAGGDRQCSWLWNAPF